MKLTHKTRDTFKPPIKSRTTNELLEIVGTPKKWNPDAIRLAKYELFERNIPESEIEKAKKSEIQNEEVEKLRKANKSYTISDFILSPEVTILELIFFWELKKDGYILKAKQQKAFRFFLLIIIVLITIVNYFFT